MSLVQHVTPLEGVDVEPDVEIDEDFHPIARKISYDVLQPPTQPVPLEDQPPALPAYQVSAARRLGMRTSFQIPPSQKESKKISEREMWKSAGGLPY